MKSKRKRSIGGVHIFIACLVIAASVFVVLTFVTVEKHSVPAKIWFEAEAASKIVPVMEIRDDGEASGGKCIEIRQNAGTGLLGLARGYASYEITLPAPGRYTLWARTYWLDGCSNSFTVEIGDEKYHFGEDSVFEKWHWNQLQLPAFESAGPIRIRIENREDGVKVDRFLITQDLNFIPQGKEGGITVVDFEEGLSGIVKPQTASRWNIAEHEGVGGSRAFRLGEIDPPAREHALVDIYHGKEFVFRCHARAACEDLRGKNVRLIFDYRGDNDFACADFMNGRVSLLGITDGKEAVIATSNESLSPFIQIGDGYHLFEIQGGKGMLLVKFDGIPAIRLDDNFVRGGAAGIGSTRGSVYYDNINIRGEIDDDFVNNFYYDEARAKQDVKGWTPLAGTWVRSFITGTHAYEATTDTYAVSISGRDIWSNYRLEVAGKGDGESAIGILFHFLDEDNYYLFKWGGNNPSMAFYGNKQLVSVRNGNTTILAEDEGGYEANQWYLLKSEVVDGTIRSYIDDALIFNVTDRSNVNGKIGLYTEGGGARQCNAPSARLWPGVYSGSSWKQVFEFQPGGSGAEQILYFCYQDEDNHYALIIPGAGGSPHDEEVVLMQVRDGDRTVLDRRESIIEYSSTYLFRLQYDEGILIVIIAGFAADDAGGRKTQVGMKFEIEDPVFTGGRIYFDSGIAPNCVFDDVKVTRVRDFYDDFSTDTVVKSIYWRIEKGDWTRLNGSFAARGGAPASALVGERDWDNYTCDLDITDGGTADGVTGAGGTRDGGASAGAGTVGSGEEEGGMGAGGATDAGAPDGGAGAGTAGMYLYYQDAGNHYLFRSACENNERRYELVRVVNGSEYILATGSGRRSGGRFHVRSFLDDGWICVLIDGATVLEAYDWTFNKGKVGLYADGPSDIYFDDLSVTFGERYERNIVFDSFFQYGTERSAERYGWLCGGDAWHVDDSGVLTVGNIESRAYAWHAQKDMREDITMELDAWAVSDSASDISVVISNEGHKAECGYAMSLNREGAYLYRGDLLVASSDTVSLENNHLYRLKLENRRGYVIGYVDGNRVLMFKDTAPLYGGNVGIFTDDGYVAVDNITAFTYPVRFYSFSQSQNAGADLCDWQVASGRWDEVVSVAHCLYGEKDTERDAVIWYKRQLPEYAAVQFECSPLKYSGEGRLIASLYGRDRIFDSGYVVIVDFEDAGEIEEFDFFDAHVQLVKRGKVISKNSIRLKHHARWSRVKMERRGNIVTVLVNGEEMIRYSDKNPPAGRMCALGVGGEKAQPLFFRSLAVYSLAAH